MCKYTPYVDVISVYLLIVVLLTSIIRYGTCLLKAMVPIYNHVDPNSIPLFNVIN